MTSVIQSAVASATAEGAAYLAATITMPAIFDEKQGKISIPPWVYNLLTGKYGNINLWAASVGLTLKDVTMPPGGSFTATVSAGGEIVASDLGVGGTEYADGDTGTVNGSTGVSAAYVVDTINAYAGAITAVDDPTKKFTVAGDQRVHAPVTGTLVVSGSTGNDGSYTIVSATLVAGPATEIVVNEAVPNAVADGNIALGYGPVLTYTLTNLGTTYAVAAGVATTKAGAQAGLGSGLTINVTKVI